MMTFALTVVSVLVVAAVAFLGFAILYFVILGMDQGDR